MQLFSTLCALAMASFAAAAPAPAHVDVRADGFWYVAGWGNPNCQGSLVWVYQGTGNACINAPTLAASVSYGVNQNTEFGWINAPTCGINNPTLAALGAPEVSTTVRAVEARDNTKALAARTVTGCDNVSVLAFRVKLL